MARKWIINDGQLIMGNTEYHYQLLGNRDKSKTIGGGRFEWKPDLYGDVTFFYSTSDDFGSVTKEQFEKVFDNSYISPTIRKCKIIFSNKEYFSDVLKELNDGKNI